MCVCTVPGEGNAYEYSLQLLRCVCMYSWLFMEVDRQVGVHVYVYIYIGWRGEPLVDPFSMCMYVCRCARCVRTFSPNRTVCMYV